MAEKQTLNMNQEQRLQQKLSPLQVQYARLLEMTSPEMEEEVRRQLDDNPALEVDPDMNDNGTDQTSTGSDTYNNHNHDVSDYYHDIASRSGSAAEWSNYDSGEPESLTEYLDRQIAELNLSGREDAIIHLITGNIDGNGYMTRSIAGISDDAAMQLGIDTTPDEVNGLWQRVRALDPAGVGAVDLRDCLLLQLDRRKADVAVKTAREMIAHYFDLFAHKRYDRLMAEMEIDSKALSEAIEVVRTLHPKPGTLVGGNPMDDLQTQVTPDFIVDTDGTEITLTMPNTLPSLKIEESFDISDVQLPAKGASSREREAISFIKSKHDEAAGFIRAIKMRRQTLYDMMRAIVSLQPEFFMSGGDTSCLRPMILRDVSDATGYDVSVISRAAAGKYVATRNGLFSLKSLFNERSGGPEADASAAQVLSALRELISEEDPSSPMSDDALVNALRTKGFDIARRTVAKYRDRAGIPVARLRRRLQS